MAQQASMDARHCTVRVPEDLFAKAGAAFAARFGTSSQKLQADDILRDILRWVADRPSQWRCDRCDDMIARAADGGLQWRFDHATGVVDCVELVHASCARPLDTAQRLRFQVVGSGPAGKPAGSGQKVWTVLPLHHLTDDDGLVQLLDMMLAERLPRDIALEILQRLHVQKFDAAAPYLAEAMRTRRFVHNLSDGLYWQGDLEETLRIDPDSAPRLSAQGTAPTPHALRSLGSHIVDSGVPKAEALAEIALAMASAGVRVAEAISRAAAYMQALATPPDRDSPPAAEEMDYVAQSLFAEALGACPSAGALLSEETEAPLLYPGNEPAPFLVVLDPLDGSENIDFGGTTGAIFGVLRRARVGIPSNDEFLRPASDLAMSGYMIFGRPLQMVIELAGQVAIFVHDPDEGGFLLCKEAHRIPATCATVSVNDSNSPYWSVAFRDAMSGVREQNDADHRRSVSRFSGAMVSDIHRVLMTGGVFAVPGDSRRPNGKLRRIYECNPISRIVRSAGGMAWCGADASHEAVPERYHERVPFVAGSADVVEWIVRRIEADPVRLG